MIETQLDLAAGTSEDLSPGIVETRFDPPHVMRSAEVDRSLAFTPENDAPATNAVGASLAEEATTLIERLRTQAGQLAGHLRSRQHDIDRREAELNSRLAGLDNEWRSARLWLSEQCAQLEERALELDRTQRDCEDRTSQLTAAEAFLESSRRDDETRKRQWLDELAKRQVELDDQAGQLTREQAAQRKSALRFRNLRNRTHNVLRRQQQEVQTQRAGSLELVRQLMQNVERRRRSLEAEAAEADAKIQSQRLELQADREEMAAQRRNLELRQHNLAAAEVLLTGDRREIEQGRARLAEERSQFEADRTAQQAQQLAAETRLAADMAQQQQSLEKRSAELDSRREALERLQVDLRQMHRETLEARLATEELWAQLSGAVPTAALTSSLSRLRGKLADHFSLASADLEEQRQELATVRESLGQQHQRLATQRLELQDWLTRRQREIEQQAARLVRREQELDQQQSQWETLRSRWQQERREYQQEIRRLLAELRHPECVA